MTVQGIPWKVRVCKKTTDEIKSLGVYLYCAKNDNTPNWTHTAFATFKLLSFNANVQAAEYFLAPYIFDHQGVGRGVVSLIKWDNLMDVGKGYVKDDAIVLNVEIEAADPNEMNQSHMHCANVDKCCDELCWSTHRLTIGNISNLMAVRSQQFEIRNLPFRFIVLKDGMKNLGFDLHSDWNSSASCKIQMTVKLISSRADKKIEQVRNRTILSFGVLGISNIISWKELMMPQNGFIQNDVIFIEVDIKASRPDGAHRNDKSNSTHDVKRAKMECPICFESLHQKKVSFVPCGHIFCTECITKVIETKKKCPTCSKMVKMDEVRFAYLPISEWV
ncbi:hypothetical protein HA402_006513 [Bradysia odoriphaga]|nr:hypothetical protein HA402_006513 [Bradysia odoriphaga]